MNDQAGMPYFTAETLRQACEAAHEHGFVQTLDRARAAAVPTDRRFPVLAVLRHDDGADSVPHVRCLVDLPAGLLTQDVVDELFARLPSLATPSTVPAPPLDAS